MITIDDLRQRRDLLEVQRVVILDMEDSLKISRKLVGEARILAFDKLNRMYREVDSKLEAVDMAIIALEEDTCGVLGNDGLIAFIAYV